MKLYIMVNQQPLQGYVNIDVSKHQLDLGNLNQICEDAECTEIVLNDILRFIPYSQLPTVIQHMSKKLRHKGKITFIFSDLNHIIRRYNIASINEQQLNEWLFINGARSCFSQNYLTAIINAVKLNTKSVDIGEDQVIVTAERP